MFKLKTHGTDSVADRLRTRFNNKPFWYRARVVLGVKLTAFWLLHTIENKTIGSFLYLCRKTYTQTCI